MLILNKNILTIGGNRLKGGPLTPPEPPEPPGPTTDEVTIGTQTWMAKNLAIDDGGEGIAIINNNYYYDRAAARRVAETVEGWHLPTADEVQTLFDYINVGGFNSLASTNSWTYGGGTNSSGFNALALGYIPSNSDTLEAEGIEARFWPYTKQFRLYHGESGDGWVDLAIISSTTTRQKCNVRLIKDT